ncbi:MAG: hypothetical protein ACD_10C00313G0001, partial [uncultured bacterium]
MHTGGKLGIGFQEAGGGRTGCLIFAALGGQYFKWPEHCYSAVISLYFWSEFMALITSLADLSVLLVEPSYMQAGLVSRMLQHQGVTQIKLLETGAEALAALAEVGNDNLVVISSLYLPDMLGTELVTVMREDTALEVVPFILVSSETRPQV